MQRKTRNILSKWILAAVLASSIHLSIPVMSHAQEIAPASSEIQASSVQSANTLKANISKVTLDKGDTKKVTLTYGGSSLNSSKANWTTSKSSVATVSNTGTITAKGKGTATITAKYSGKSVTISVTVNEDAGLVAKQSKVTIKKGKTSTIGLTYNGKALTGSNATWTTSNSSIATVKNGVVTAKAKGTATITAKYKNESVKVTVTVEDTAKLEATQKQVSLKKGETKTIQLKYDGTNVTGSSAGWATSNSAVATVNNGVVTAKAKGKATITAVYKGEFADVEITVQDDKALLEATQTKVTLKKGDTQTLRLKYDGANVTGSKAAWSSSKSSVATVKDGVVTAKGVGTATINAVYKGESVDIEVKVENSKAKLEATESKITLKADEKQTIRLKYDGATVTGSKAVWSSSKSSIASVNDGVVTAKAKGTATITAFYKDEFVDIQVTVEESKSKLEATQTKITLKKGDTKKVKLKYDGDTLNNSKAEWGTSKSSVASVDKGTIKAKAKGTATITATYKGAKTTIEVTVEDADSLEVDDDSISVKVRKTETIRVTYNGKKVSGSDVKWSTSKSSVATVKDGVVTGKKKGSAVITAEYKGEEVEIKVKVK